jgi:CHAT domain-containing protein
MEAPELMSIPLECLYIPPPVRTFPALTRRYSIVRYLSQARPAPQHGLVPPVRLLAVLPNPSDTAPLNIEGEEEILRRTLAAATHIQIRVLKNATWAKLKELVLSFQPHILHYVGHGVLDPKSREASLVLEGADGTGFPLPAVSLATLLRDAPLRLVVLNACDTGTAPTNDAITGLAGALIGAGIPAAIGTLRAVADEAALLFTRELYRCFGDGYSIETAIIEARKALSVEKWDWSLYSLFTSLTDLGTLRLVTETSRQEGRAGTQVPAAPPPPSAGG